MKLIKPSYSVEYMEMDGGLASLKKIELFGRVCHKSEEKITDDSCLTFVKRLLSMTPPHESVLEHCSASVRFICDRGVSHELVRHRLASFSQESTRYCKYDGEVAFIIPSWVNVAEGDYLDTVACEKAAAGNTASLEWMYACMDAAISYGKLLDMGWSAQQARAVLPNSLKTDIVVTANFREWRHIFRMRAHPAAHPQMLELMLRLLREFRSLVPVVFDDVGME